MIYGQFIRFCVVGTLGFVADSSILTILTQLFTWGPIAARIASFLGAATLTWLLNTRFTFRSKAKARAGQWALYIAATAIGAAINIGAYSSWLALHTPCVSVTNLVLGVAIGSVAALFFNFFVSKLIVFDSSLEPMLASGITSCKGSESTGHDNVEHDANH